ncbi:hypothetical protein N7468_006673 [Penicillium chermesinum]|uniref:LysM domain-containing protein n=1 Tax=Penicillium chermesinum TaxID=63820 RepID=A0A9W9NT19_9EURO|nr:uncharacterized protein N7468_006673 [Penicillium chermesinum]KAJ5225448.1 hypothetical protein N7468_006673 [Penicillium chermesinum]
MSFQTSFANASLTPNSVSASSASTSMRSRPRRLVSFLEDDEDDSRQSNNNSSAEPPPLTTGSSANLLDGTVRSRGATPSPLSSRGTSPMPLKHPSRVTQSERRSRNENSFFGSNGTSKTSSSRGATDFLDSSWSSIQSLASSVLGSDNGRNALNNGTKSHARRKPSRSDVYIKSTPRSTPTWGPSGPASPEIGTGTKEERQALVQAKKREALLLADSDLISGRNIRHKRRDSEDYFDQAPDPEQDEDALAYVHQVQPSDSITGVTIKYGCQVAVFRKANGFWPSDSIQSRKTVLLPVDACSVKGRPIRTTEPLDLLGPDTEDASGSSITPDVEAPSTEQSSLDSTEAEANRVWKHESWVQVDGFPAPVQIGRVPRRALGFFPRSRRKSVSHSESGPPSVFSPDATRSPSPDGSPDLDSFQDTLPRTRPRNSQANPKDSRNPRPLHRRQRSSINLSGTGVGTLDREATGPGPALDGLTKFFAQHMPHLAPPPQPDPLRKASFESGSPAASNASTSLENIGGALEGWVRKVATRAKVGISELQQGSANQQATSRGRSVGLWGDW